MAAFPRLLLVDIVMYMRHSAYACVRSNLGTLVMSLSVSYHFFGIRNDVYIWCGGNVVVSGVNYNNNKK